MEREVVGLLKRAVDDLTATNRDLARYQLGSERSAAARGAENVRLLGELKAELGKIREALSDVDQGLDVVATATTKAAKKPGLFAQITGWMDKNPALKAAVLGTAMQVLAALGAYATFRFSGLAPTPTPVQVAQPVTVSPSLYSAPEP